MSTSSLIPHHSHISHSYYFELFLPLLQHLPLKLRKPFNSPKQIESTTISAIKLA